MPSRLTDEVWLRERVAAYASNVEIAAEAGVTTRAVRYALRRYGIKHPLRQDLADVAVAEYQAGTPLDQIAAKVHRSRTWIYQAADAAGAQRPPHHRRVSRQYPQLNDAAWMAARFDAGGSVKSIAHELGADRHAVRKRWSVTGSTVGPDSSPNDSARPSTSSRRPAKAVAGAAAPGA